MIRDIILVLHITSAAMVFGAGAGIPRNLRNTLKAGKDAFLIAAQDANKRGGIITISALATLITGVILIFQAGGMKAIPTSIHIALTLMLLSLGFSATVMRPNAAALLKLAEGADLDTEKATGHIKRLTMGQGILHLLWIAMLCMMIFRFRLGG